MEMMKRHLLHIWFAQVSKKSMYFSESNVSNTTKVPLQVQNCVKALISKDVVFK